MSKVNHQMTAEDRRKKRIRAKVRGTADRPRMSIYRSVKYTSLQLIDDERAVTLAAATESELTDKGTKTERAIAVAKLLAQKAKKIGIIRAVFDRVAYKYHGRVKAVADTLREAGIQV